jgi:hypothetical protein
MAFGPTVIPANAGNPLRRSLSGLITDAGGYWIARFRNAMTDDLDHFWPEVILWQDSDTFALC